MSKHYKGSAIPVILLYEVYDLVSDILSPTLYGVCDRVTTPFSEELIRPFQGRETGNAYLSYKRGTPTESESPSYVIRYTRSLTSYPNIQTFSPIPAKIDTTPSGS